MLCLLLFSLLIIGHAQENFTQELNADLSEAFQNLTMDQNASVNLTTLNSFDVFVADAEQDFNREASIPYEEIEWILYQARQEALRNFP